MNVLVADSHIDFRYQLIGLLNQDPNLKVVGEAETIEDTIEKTNNLHPDLVLLAITFPDGDGLDQVEEIRSHSHQTKVVIITRFDSIDFVLKAIRSGAGGYLLKDQNISKMLPALHTLDEGNFVISSKLAKAVLSVFSQIREYLDNGVNLGKLTARERDVFKLLCTGASNQEIAAKLFVSRNTVRIHIQRILKKLNLKNRREAREKYSAAIYIHNNFQD